MATEKPRLRATFKFADRPKVDEQNPAKLEAPAAGNRISYDSEVAGLGVRVTAAGARAWILNYRTRTGRERRYTIGAVAGWSVKAVREEAERLKREIRDGKDPLEALEADRDAKTVNDLCDWYLESKSFLEKRPATQRDYRAIIKNEIRPALKHELVAKLDQEKVGDLHTKITKRGATYTANRTVSVLSKMLNERRTWWTGNNPASGIERNQEVKRKRYLKAIEVQRLTAALNAFPLITKKDGTTTIDAGNLQSANIIRLLMLTGARRGEALAATWDQFAEDEDGTLWWHKPGSTTKQKTDHDLPLSDEARAVVESIKRGKSEYLFPGVGGEGHQTDVKKAWATITAADLANLPGVRLHDLRHTYASVLVSEGQSLPIVGAMLGHSQTATTARYAHLMDDALKHAAKQAGARLTAQPKLKVVQ